MKPDQAAENLQVIRTLMERSAVYRRALAPIMTYCGIVGLVGGLLAWKLNIQTTHQFVVFWNGVAAMSLIGSFMLVRRQAFKADESFWSPPTKRVSHAMMLPLFVGFFVGLIFAFGVKADDSETQGIITMVWAWLYGCALHSGGFSVSRGFRLFGWVYALVGCALLSYLVCSNNRALQPNLLMGAVFGGLHLAYGIYLYFTEKRRNEP